MKPKARQKNNALLLDFCVEQTLEIKLLVLNESVRAVDRFNQERRLTSGTAAAEIVKKIWTRKRFWETLCPLINKRINPFPLQFCQISTLKVLFEILRKKDVSNQYTKYGFFHL